MIESAPPCALEEVVDCLGQLARQGADPEAARERLASLAQRHPMVRLRLLWQREAYDGSFHFDVLITQPELGTVSVSVAPEGGLPWSLRGGQRVSERTLVQVNGVAMEMSQAIAHLDSLFHDVDLAGRLVRASVLQDELARDPVELDSEELQQAMDAFRRAHRLLTPEATATWLDRRSMSHRELEELVAGEAAVRRLRERVTASQCIEYFLEHRRELDFAHTARVVFDTESGARTFLSQVEAGEDFCAAALQAFTGNELRPAEPFLWKLQRHELEPVLADQIFDAKPGALVGPFCLQGGHAVVRVLSVQAAVLDLAQQEAIRQVLFTEWLAERVREASVQWYWGKPGQAGR